MQFRNVDRQNRIWLSGIVKLLSWVHSSDNIKNGIDVGIRKYPTEHLTISNFEIRWERFLIYNILIVQPGFSLWNFEIFGQVLYNKLKLFFQCFLQLSSIVWMRILADCLEYPTELLTILSPLILELTFLNHTKLVDERNLRLLSCLVRCQSFTPDIPGKSLTLCSKEHGITSRLYNLYDL